MPSLPGPPKPPRLPTVEFSEKDSGVMRFSYLGTIDENNGAGEVETLTLEENEDIAGETKINIDVAEESEIQEKTLADFDEDVEENENIKTLPLESPIKDAIEELNDNLLTVDESIDNSDSLNLPFQSD